MIIGFVTHDKAYVINGLNESTQSLVLSCMYDFQNSSFRKKQLCNPTRKWLKSMMKDIGFRLPKVLKLS